MTYLQVIRYFKSQYKAAAALGISRITVASWRKRGFIPANAQAMIQQHTRGKLRVGVPFDVADAKPIEPRCPHNELVSECDACMVAGDLAFDAARERAVFGR